MKTRLWVVGIFFAVTSAALLVRLFFWQVTKADELSKDAASQQNYEKKILAPRGNILAADGTWLASSVEAWLVWASKPDMVETPRQVANRLAPLLLNEVADHREILQEAMRIEGILTKEGAVWIPIKQKVSTDVKKNIEASKIAGIGFDRSGMRSYPEASSAAQLLGFVGKDEEGNDQGYFGLEGFYDLSLSGKPGFVKRESDAKGAPILFGDSKEVEASAGVDLVTHIDKTIQALVEDRLKKGIETYGAATGSVVVMDPQTGAVLAAASLPSYDPGKYFDYGDTYFRDPVVASPFEPGSIFKPIVMASGLDAGVITPETICDICGEALKVDKYSIETWNKKYFADSTMTDIIVHSDNVGMAFVGQKLGAERLYEYLRKFGVGEATGIDLQGEVSPALRLRDSWNVVDVATATFGQGVAVTPIQMTRAVAVIANGGRLVTPQVVWKIKKDGWEEDKKAQIGERVISEKVAKEITDMMVSAVKKGEAGRMAPQGFRIAGKTGTAQIPLAGHYDAEKTIGSFVGFAPAESAKFVMLVTLWEPKTSQWGTETAAPLWFSIARELFPYLGIQPEN